MLCVPFLFRKRVLPRVTELTCSLPADLTFQLWTHAYLYAPPKTPRPPSSSTAALLIYNEGPQPPSEGKVFRIPSLPSWGSSSSSSSSASTNLRGRNARTPADEENADEPGDFSAEDAAQHDNDLARIPTAASDTFRRSPSKDKQERDLEAAQEQHVEFSPMDEHEPELSVWFAFALLAVITALTGVTAECLVDSIDGLTETGNVSKEFVAWVSFLCPRVLCKLRADSFCRRKIGSSCCPSSETPPSTSL